MKLALFLLTLLLPLATYASAPPSVPRLGKFEASFTLAGQTGNPFDPADNDVDAVFTGPNKTPVVVPAFWDGDRWRVRFAPLRVGRYTFAVTRNGKSVRPADLSAGGFTCTASKNAGFVRRDPKVVQRFVFDNGQTYYPLGINAAWTGAGQGYSGIFTHMGQAHMNWVRVWMNNWDGKNLEWAASKADNPKIGTYLMNAARRWDMIFDQAAQNGVYVQMTLQHHGQYTAQTDPNWADNPFNVANGGFLQKPDDFFTNAEARRLTRAKYRYIVARWGYSTHLLAYELFNEVQNIGEARTHFQDVVNWHKEMAAYIRSLDTNHHLVTTSNSPEDDPLAHIGLDYDQMHSYPPDILSTFAGVRTAKANAPTFYGEWGLPEAGRSPRQAVQDGVWASLMSPTAGAGQYWYGDQIDANGWWPVFASAAGFAHSFNLASLGTTTPLRVAVDAPGPPAPLSFAPGGDWGPTTKTEVTLSGDGSAPDLSGISSYIQGTSNRNLMPQPIAFHLTCAVPCQLQVLVGNVSKTGAHLTLSLDGAQVAEQDFPATANGTDANQTISIAVPKGIHTVSLYNTGMDWFVAKRITVTDFVPGVAVLARGNAQGLAFWAYNRDRASVVPRAATLHFDGLNAGAYRVRLWDTASAQPRPEASVTVQSGTASVALPAFSGDVAGIVIPAQK